MRDPPPLYPYLASNTPASHQSQNYQYPHHLDNPHPPPSRIDQPYNPFPYPTHDPSYLHAGQPRPFTGSYDQSGQRSRAGQDLRAAWSQAQTTYVDLGNPHRDAPYTAVPANYSPSFPMSFSSDDQSSSAQVGDKRPRSGGSEVEAGLALAGLGSSMGTTAADGVIVKTENVEARSNSPVKRKGGKKVKTGVPEEEKPSQPQGTVAKKSCAECRRMKAKCDRVFPCSNCKLL